MRARKGNFQFVAAPKPRARPPGVRTWWEKASGDPARPEKVFFLPDKNIAGRIVTNDEQVVKCSSKNLEQFFSKS